MRWKDGGRSTRESVHLVDGVLVQERRSVDDVLPLRLVHVAQLALPGEDELRAMAAAVAPGAVVELVVDRHQRIAEVLPSPAAAAALGLSLVIGASCRQVEDLLPTVALDLEHTVVQHHPDPVTLKVEVHWAGGAAIHLWARERVDGSTGQGARVFIGGSAPPSVVVPDPAAEVVRRAAPGAAIVRLLVGSDGRLAEVDVGPGRPPSGFAPQVGRPCASPADVFGPEALRVPLDTSVERIDGATSAWTVRWPDGHGVVAVVREHLDATGAAGSVALLAALAAAGSPASTAG
ncbi:hypothetical protein B7486_63175 [cyanobacterium TDX16]|nr:hypothetical protein B7486_63175 [cyanobacterium TDX16]